jgi:metallo-beta-lactamase class B
MRLRHFIAIVLSVFPFVASAKASAPTDTVRIGKYIKIHALTDHIHRYICSNYDVPSNGLIYIDNHEAIMIDAPNGAGITDSLLNWISISKRARVKAVVVTHWHAQDRMGGILAVKQRHIPSYCFEQTAAIATQKGLPYPDHTFQDSITLKAGNRSLFCWFPGAGHTKDNIVVWFPKEKLLYGGCFVKDMSAQNLGYTNDADAKAWPQSIQKTLKKFPDMVTVVPGHYNYGNRDLLLHTLQLLKEAEMKE